MEKKEIEKSSPVCVKFGTKNYSRLFTLNYSVLRLYFCKNQSKAFRYTNYSNIWVPHHPIYLSWQHP